MATNFSFSLPSTAELKERIGTVIARSELGYWHDSVSNYYLIQTNDIFEMSKKLIAFSKEVEEFARDLNTLNVDHEVSESEVIDQKIKRVVSDSLTVKLESQPVGF